MLKSNKILILGYGNPGRQDDGLGPLFIKKIEDLGLDNNISLDTDYQLTLETAHDLIGYNEVIFVDASMKASEPFLFELVRPNKNLIFHTHSVTPESIIQLTNNLYEAYPTAYILAIRGYKFNEFGEYITKQARNNCDLAVDFIKKYLMDKKYI